MSEGEQMFLPWAGRFGRHHQRSALYRISPHSDRSTIIGSTVTERRAGITHANTATNSCTAAIIATVAGSSGLTLNSMFDNARVASTAARIPKPKPFAPSIDPGNGSGAGGLETGIDRKQVIQAAQD